MTETVHPPRLCDLVSTLFTQCAAFSKRKLMHAHTATMGSLKGMAVWCLGAAADMVYPQHEPCSYIKLCMFKQQ